MSHTHHTADDSVLLLVDAIEDALDVNELQTVGFAGFTSVNSPNRDVVTRKGPRFDSTEFAAALDRVLAARR